MSAFLQKYRVKIFVALLLTFVAGFVDILGYVGICHLFTAHMTGTTVQLGHDALLGNWDQVLAAASIILSFFLGSIFGRAVIQTGSRLRIRRAASITLICETLMIYGVAVWSTNLNRIARGESGYLTERYLLLAVLAAAMGLQTATLTGIGPLTIHTTFVTGMLNKFAQLATRISFRAYDIFASPSSDESIQSAQSEDLRQSLVIFLIWILYVCGAMLGTWFYKPWGMRSLRLAATLLLVAVAVDQVHPLSVEEEKEQAES